MAEFLMHWKCDVCGQEFTDIMAALKCENREPPVVYSVGTIYGNNKIGALHENLVFAIASNKIEEHWNRYRSWICRDNIAGDSLGIETHGFSYNRLGEYESHVNKEMPAFKRMVAWLRKNNIVPYIWNGKEAVLLDDKNKGEHDDNREDNQ